MQRWLIDRIEGDWAVCETDGGMEKLPRAALPQGAREGDVLLREDGVLRVDEPGTAARRAAVEDRFQRLKKKR